MAPGGTLFRFPPHFGENVLPHGSHEWLPYSKDEKCLKTVINNLPLCCKTDKAIFSKKQSSQLHFAWDDCFGVNTGSG